MHENLLYRALVASPLPQPRVDAFEARRVKAREYYAAGEQLESEGRFEKAKNIYVLAIGVLAKHDGSYIYHENLTSNDAWNIVVTFDRAVKVSEGKQPFSPELCSFVKLCLIQFPIEQRPALSTKAIQFLA